MNLQFKTSPIKMTLDECFSLGAYFSRMRVHPTNFICDDGMTLQQKAMQEPLEENSFLGNPIQINHDRETNTAVIWAEGGFDIAQVQYKDRYTTTGLVVGNVLDDVFSEKFCENHKGVIVYLENCDETGVLDDGISRVIHMDQYHSKEAKLSRAKARAKALEGEIAELNRKQFALEQTKDGKLKELNILKVKYNLQDSPTSDLQF
ncbi:hypothetical protein OFK41_07765 [Acinetobacter baumannii]|uniref:hypothetical protein n=1 Tax=Acinetobacter baumannii TaxID=470 RepID=UPI00225660FD|nr:hypothetical protein [Acinetobacter baumannii]MCX3034103.1 hypothetical protein [Acinetobacter baumannii]